MKKIYFDNASSTKIDSEVLEKTLIKLKNIYGNPSSQHGHGREAKVIIEQSRKKIANLLGCPSERVIFTSGGTEGNNWILQKSVENFKIKHIITSHIEHLSVLLNIQYIVEKENIKVSYVSLDEKGHIDYASLTKLLKTTKDTTLISLMHANNEIGNITDIELVSDIAREYNAYYHSDTVQTIGHMDIKFEDVDLDFSVGSAHKFHGPKGVGFIYINEVLKISPLLFGGDQEMNMRGGTENIFGIVGMSYALEKSLDNLHNYRKYILDLKNFLILELQNTFPNISFNGDSANYEKSLYTIINLQIPYNFGSDMLLLQLDMHGISASLGSACNSGTFKNSHVLENILAERENIVNLRISLSKNNTKEEIVYFIKILKKVIFKK